MFGFLLPYFMIFVLLFPCFLPGQSSFFFLFPVPPSPHWFGKCMFIQFYSFSKILLCIWALPKSRAVTSFFSTIRLLLPSPLLILGAFVVWYYGSIFFFFFFWFPICCHYCYHFMQTLPAHICFSICQFLCLPFLLAFSLWV